MDFSKRQDDPRRHLLGLSVVVALHVLIVYALVNGLARKVVDVVRAPIETRLIEEIIKPPPPPPEPPPPPPPERVVPPPPKVAPPPPPFVPPPEVKIPEPVPEVRAELQLKVSPPPPTPENTPPQRIEVPESSMPQLPQTKTTEIPQAGIVCTRMPAPVAPSVAYEVKGSLFVIGTLRNGRVVQVDVERNTLKGVNDRRTQRAFVSAVETAMKDGYVCAGDGVQIRQEFFFDIR